MLPDSSFNKLSSPPSGEPQIDGVIHDTHDPSLRGTRCVYGYWQCVAGERFLFIDSPLTAT
jgi:hypothetical protein